MTSCLLLCLMPSLLGHPDGACVFCVHVQLVYFLSSTSSTHILVSSGLTFACTSMNLTLSGIVLTLANPRVKLTLAWGPKFSDMPLLFLQKDSDVRRNILDEGQTVEKQTVTLVSMVVSYSGALSPLFKCLQCDLRVRSSSTIIYQATSS